MFSMVRLLLVVCYLMLEYAPLTSVGLIWLAVAWWFGGDTSTPLWCLSVMWLVTGLYQLVLRRLLKSPE